MKLFPSLVVIALTTGLAVSGCSSAPERPAEIFTNRDAARAQMEMARQAVMNHEPAVARQFLSEAWRLAVRTDDADTRIRVLLATGNTWYSEGVITEAMQLWEQAQTEADKHALALLSAASTVHIARGTLAEGHPEREMPQPERKRRAEEAKNRVLAVQKDIQKDRLYAAFAWRVLALAEKELGNTEAAINAIGNSAKIHDSGQYLEDAAYDWYITASIYSKAEQYPDALAALDLALRFDRRAENAAGLGRDWLAIGAVREKSGDTNGARSAWAHARDIFRAAFLTVQAEEAEALLTR